MSTLYHSLPLSFPSLSLPLFLCTRKFDIQLTPLCACCCLLWHRVFRWVYAACCLVVCSAHGSWLMDDASAMAHGCHSWHGGVSCHVGNINCISLQLPPPPPLYPPPSPPPFSYMQRGEWWSCCQCVMIANRRVQIRVHMRIWMSVLQWVSVRVCDWVWVWVLCSSACRWLELCEFSCWQSDLISR